MGCPACGIPPIRRPAAGHSGNVNTINLVALTISTIATVWDVKTRRIPNVLTVSAIVAAVPYLLFEGGSPALIRGLLGAATGLLLFFPYFALGGLGAGDVKLLAAIGMWLGPGQTLWVALFASMAGGVIAFGVALAHGYLRQAVTNLWLLMTHWRVSGPRPLESVTLRGGQSPRFPYSVPITAGLVLTLWLR
jgi:prepilin peptidase CpaA